jgi:hypothetical protein
MWRKAFMNLYQLQPKKPIEWVMDCPKEPISKLVIANSVKEARAIAGAVWISEDTICTKIDLSAYDTATCLAETDYVS